MEITQMDYHYGNICMRRYAPICTISSDEDWRAWKRCKSRVSAYSWLPWSIDPSHMSMKLVNNPINHGWKEEDGKLLPIWTTLLLAKDVFHLDVKCTCPITCCQCKRVKTKLKCTRQCKGLVIFYWMHCSLTFFKQLCKYLRGSTGWPKSKPISSIIINSLSKTVARATFCLTFLSIKWA